MEIWYNACRVLKDKSGPSRTKCNGDDHCIQVTTGQVRLYIIKLLFFAVICYIGEIFDTIFYHRYDLTLVLNAFNKLHKL